MMNIDTDTQYAFSRAVAGHMFSNYDSVLKIDGEVGNKKLYDPRSWGREAESAMAARVVEACKQLRQCRARAELANGLLNCFRAFSGLFFGPVAIRLRSVRSREHPSDPIEGESNLCKALGARLKAESRTHGGATTCLELF